MSGFSSLYTWIVECVITLTPHPWGFLKSENSPPHPINHTLTFLWSIWSAFFRLWRILWHGSYKAAHPTGEWQRLWVISWSFCIYRREGPTAPGCHHTQSLDTVYMLPPACLPCVKLDISSVIQMSHLALTTFSQHVRWLCLASSSSLAVTAELHLLFPSFVCSVQCLVFALRFATHIELLSPVACVNSVVHPFTCECTKCREPNTLFLISFWTNYHLSDQLNIRKKG